MLPADDHVHTEHSWDAPEASMWKACERAVSLGLPSIAFTDHADFTVWAYPHEQPPSPTVRVIESHAASGFLDVDRYWRSLDRCREAFPDLVVRSGLELGEPHLFTEQVGTLLGSRGFDRVLGSLHSVPYRGQLTYAPDLIRLAGRDEAVQTYLAELVRMIEASTVFEVLAHIEFPVRAWPTTGRPYRPTDFEDGYREVLRALARSGRVLEVNTAEQMLAVEILRWWREEGGKAVSFGSDSHRPDTVAGQFASAAALVRSCGFRPGSRPTDFWCR